METHKLDECSNLGMLVVFINLDTASRFPDNVEQTDNLNQISEAVYLVYLLPRNCYKQIKELAILSDKTSK